MRREPCWLGAARPLPAPRRKAARCSRSPPPACLLPRLEPPAGRGRGSARRQWWWRRDARTRCAPPWPAKLERLAGDVCGELNRSVTASFMHEGVIYLGCTGGALGSAWVRYDTVTGQREAIDDVVGSVVPRRHQARRDADPAPSAPSRPRPPTSTGGRSPRPTPARRCGCSSAPTPRRRSSPGRPDRSTCLSATISNRGMLALWHLVRSDFEPPALQVALHFESGISVRDIIGGPRTCTCSRTTLGFFPPAVPARERAGSGQGRHHSSGRPRAELVRIATRPDRLVLDHDGDLP